MTERSLAGRGLPRRPLAIAGAVLMALALPRLALAANGAQRAADPVDVSGLVHVCSSCHGPRGISINTANFANLAGQQKQYLVTQLRAFRDHKRADPHARTYMWGMAARLTDAQIEALADHYSRLPPEPGRHSDPQAEAAGRQIFEHGIAARGVPPCAACHGPHAGGNAVIPRLAGQHREYIRRELSEFASGARANEVMHANAKNLTAAEIGDLAAFVASQ